MTKNKLNENLNKVEKMARASKFQRMMMHPIKYFNAIIFRELIYKRRRVEKLVSSKTFFDTEMNLLLPSSTDIYLTGGKSHDSEIRLARFLINNLEKEDTFVDVGAHYGYFTMLGSTLVGKNGKVFSFEASPTTYDVLHKNTHNNTNIFTNNLAVSDEISELKFYEFPNLYSEYNTLDIDQFRNDKWFSKNKPKEINIQSVILDDFLKDENIYPKVFKIDVEGAENKVINGLRNYLRNNAPYVVMEYLSNARGNIEHQDAECKLYLLGFSSFVINKSGHLDRLNSISTYLDENNLESDNIVFVKD